MYTFEEILKKIAEYEIPWCNTMGFFNPYVDPFKYFISKNIPDFDGQAFMKYKNHNFVYDKLWIAKSQGLMAGDLDKLKKNDNIILPIFVKPRWGHETASSKNCFKVKSWDEIDTYKQIPDMMWSEFIDAKEQMTDYFLINGQIVHQITYIYSDSQNEFIDEWKYIDCESKPISKITALIFLRSVPMESIITNHFIYTVHFQIHIIPYRLLENIEICINHKIYLFLKILII